VSGPTRLKLLIAYDGRPFRGWQSQSSGDAVQDRIEQALARICGEHVVVHGAGRTDSGVHALGQVAHIDVPAGRLPLEKWAGAINGHLPREIRVMKVTRTRAEFHARFDARGKIYTYRVWNGAVLPPLELGRAWHLGGELDLPALRSCAALLEGSHDFASFSANRGHAPRETVRTLYSVEITRRGPLVTLRFRGDGFLYRMVRLLTGTLLRCAQHRAEPSLITDLLASCGAAKTSFAAPAEGLYLTRVLY